MIGSSENRDTSKYCEFHGDHGHQTKDCRQLKWEIEKLAREGRLKEFMPRVFEERRERDSDRRNRDSDQRDRRYPEKKEGSGPSNKDRSPERKKNNEKPQRRTIYTIHGGFASGGSTMTSRRKHIKKAEVAAVFNLTEDEKKSPRMPISFSDADKEGVHYPHDDALVVEVGVADCNLAKVLVDTGSSVNIIFYSTLEKMGYQKKDIERVTMNLVGFTGEAAAVLGKVTLPIEARGKTMFVTLMVIRAKSGYNAILGRPWLHEMEAIPSTYHQRIKFYKGDKVVTLRSSQVVARTCFVEEMRGQPRNEK